MQDRAKRDGCTTPRVDRQHGHDKADENVEAELAGDLSGLDCLYLFSMDLPKDSDWIGWGAFDYYKNLKKMLLMWFWGCDRPPPCDRASASTACRR
jgi:hypothetical protein